MGTSGTPAYEAVKVGDTYKMVRVDPEHKARVSKLTVGGGLLALMGIAKRGVLGTGLVLVGGTLIYCGLAERDPMELLDSLLRRRRVPKDKIGPSHHHSHAATTDQVPEDEVVRTGHGKLPRQRPPARSRSTQDLR